MSELSDRAMAAIAKIKDANRKLEVCGVLAACLTARVHQTTWCSL